MVSVASEGESQSKIDFILKAAQKRLGLYGYEKTTMREIAADISMSKASLYYYYPDKDSLFKAVIENEQKDFLSELDRRLAELADADKMIIELVEIRHTLFRKFLNLSKFRLSADSKVKPMFNDLYNRMREIEIDILTRVFTKGKESGIFQFEDASEMAQLFSDLLQGIRIIEIKRMIRLEMTEEENDHLVKMLRNATLLFINGLKYNKLSLSIK